MPAEAFKQSALGLDLSARVVNSSAITGSPAAAAETIVATSPALNPAAPFALGVLVIATVDITIGTAGTAINLRLRQTGLAGAIVQSTGAITGGIAAANVVSFTVVGFDTAPIAGGVYVCTAQVTAATAASAVSATTIIALAI